MNTRTLLQLLTLLLAMSATVGFTGCTSDSPTDTTDESDKPGLIYYSRLTDDQKSADLVSIRADGTEEQVVRYNAHVLTPLHNGTMLIISLDGDTEELGLLDLASGTVSPVSTAHEPSMGGLSQDGALVWYTARLKENNGSYTYSLYVVDVTSSGERLIDPEITGQSTAVFSPDGSQIVYYLDNPTTNMESLYISNTDGTGRRLVTEHAQAGGDNINKLAWSPDGSRIVFAREGTSSGSETVLWTIRPDGSGERKLTDGPLINEVTPDYAGDGGRIALTGGVRDAGSKYDIDIWMVNSDGSGLENITNTPEESEAELLPRWSPDDASVLCISYDLTQPGDPIAGSLHVVDLETSENRTVVADRNVVRAYWAE